MILLKEISLKINLNPSCLTCNGTKSLESRAKLAEVCWLLTVKHGCPLSPLRPLLLLLLLLLLNQFNPWLRFSTHIILLQTVAAVGSLYWTNHWASEYMLWSNWPTKKNCYRYVCWGVLRFLGQVADEKEGGQTDWSRLLEILGQWVSMSRLGPADGMEKMTETLAFLAIFTIPNQIKHVSMSELGKPSKIKMPI